MSNIRKANKYGKVKQDAQNSKNRSYLGQNDSITTDMIQDGAVTSDKLSVIEVVQDFTTIGSIGGIGQQFAGHLYDVDLLGSAESLAYYKFANGAMTTDSEGSYTLTPSGTAPSNANGITGSDYAAYFNGSAYYTQPTLLDSPSSLTNGIGISFWFKADDGQPASRQYLMSKINDETGASFDWLGVRLEASGNLAFSLSYADSGSTNLNSVTIFPNGAMSRYYHVVVNVDVINGMRMWIDGVLESINPSETNLPSDGTARDFIVGAFNWGGTIADQFTGHIALLQIHDIVYNQKDIDKLYSVRYDLTGFSNTDFDVTATVQKDGDSDFTRAINWNGLEVHRTSSAIYRAGFTSGFGLSASDKLRIVGRK